MKNMEEMKNPDTLPGHWINLHDLPIFMVKTQWTSPENSAAPFPVQPIRSGCRSRFRIRRTNRNGEADFGIGGLHIIGELLVAAPVEQGAYRHR